MLPHFLCFLLRCLGHLLCRLPFHFSHFHNISDSICYLSFRPLLAVCAPCRHLDLAEVLERAAACPSSAKPEPGFAARTAAWAVCGSRVLHPCREGGEPRLVPARIAFHSECPPRRKPAEAQVRRMSALQDISRPDPFQPSS